MDFAAGLRCGGGRAAEFDSSLDPIVRIEAMRLRAALSNYNAGPGRNEEIKILLPKGGYVPVFERACTSMPLIESDA